MTTEVAQFNRGDKVRHTKRPEWGVGQVEAIQRIMHEGRQAFRVTVTFAQHGRVAVNTAIAPLVREDDWQQQAADFSPASGTNGGEKGWLDSLGQGEKLSYHALSELPYATRDPLASLGDRLISTMDLYRFEPTPRGLIEWASAQTGLDDPLQDWQRHDLENGFRAFERARQGCFEQLVREAVKAADRGALERAASHSNKRAKEALVKIAKRRV